MGRSTSSRKEPESKSAYFGTDQMTTYPNKESQGIQISEGMKQTLIAWAPAEITVIFLVILAALTWQDPTHKHLPDDLIGEWHTTDTKYTDRALLLDQACITFMTGQGGVSVGFIKNVQESSDGNRRLFTISYTVDNVLNEVTFYYDASNGQNLYFKNQEKIIWTKDQGG
jgi:hypothetical protein